MPTTLQSPSATGFDPRPRTWLVTWVVTYPDARMNGGGETEVTALTPAAAEIDMLHRLLDDEELGVWTMYDPTITATADAEPLD